MTRFPASGGGSGPPYTYVMDGYPSDAEEGESLYHVTEDAAYVYTGSSWVEQTVTNHSQLAGVSADNHHSRYTDTEARSATDGQIDADTVDGNHASDLETPGSTHSYSDTEGWETVTSQNDAGSSTSVPLYVPVSRAQIYVNSTDYETYAQFYLNIAGGGTVQDSFTVSGGGSNTSTIAVNGVVKDVTVDIDKNKSTADGRVEPAFVPGHNHSL